MFIQIKQITNMTKRLIANKHASATIHYDVHKFKLNCTQKLPPAARNGLKFKNLIQYINEIE